MFGLKLFSIFLVAGIFLSSPVHSQRISVDGYIVNEYGKHLREVTVFERLTETGTISDQTGYFRLLLHSGEVELVFKDKDYIPHTERLTVKKDTSMVVELIAVNRVKETTDEYAPSITVMNKSVEER
jgi:hypothetical protein